MIKATLAEQAYQYIIEQIKYGKFKDGEKMDEAKIVEDLGISRTPVREALLQLAADDVLVNVARKGFFVKDLGAGEKLNACIVLGHLDALSAVLAAPLMQESDFNELTRMAEEMDKFIEREEFEPYSDMQEKFHKYYQELCPNHPLLETMDYLIKKYMISTFYADKPMLYDHLAVSNRDHKKMIELMKAGKTDELYSIVLKHWGYSIDEE